MYYCLVLARVITINMYNHENHNMVGSSNIYAQITIVLESLLSAC